MFQIGDYMYCYLCPKKCGVDREKARGFCGAPSVVKVARASLHMWEEPPISGKNGSGAVFFSHCNLKCVFCQNYKISDGGFGVEIDTRRLSEIFLHLADTGAENINLVSPTPYVYEIISALDMCRGELKIPVIWNTGGYENVETLELLKNYVDIFLPDFKYITPELAKRYSNAEDYPVCASRALETMLKLVGKESYGDDGMMKRGVILRHLVLPSHSDETVKVLRFLKENFGVEDYSLSLMRQYYPCHKAENYKQINRKLTSYEFNKAENEAMSLGFHGFSQDKGADTGEYTPEFDLFGIKF